MRILVTGGAGFVGSQYVRGLVSGGYAPSGSVDVTVLDKLSYAGTWDNLPAGAPGLTLVRGDVCDAPTVRETMRGHDAVVHFAAESHVDRSITDGDAFIRTNVAGTHTVLQAALDVSVRRVVHVSTDEVYGSIAAGSWTEESPLLPNSPYAASKASADLVARSLWRTHGLNVSITRCSNNYGPYQHPEKLIPRFVTNLLEDRPVPLYGDGSNVREWVHVEDHCRAVHAVLMRGRAGEVYNVGGDEQLTNLALTERILGLCGAGQAMIERVEDRKGHDLRYALDDSRIRRELGWAPRIPFGDGLAATVAWYRENGLWWRAARDRAAAPVR
jgi:dTDP-glucose 4,6-dehydratase